MRKKRKGNHVIDLICTLIRRYLGYISSHWVRQSEQWTVYISNSIYVYICTFKYTFIWAFSTSFQTVKSHFLRGEVMGEIFIFYLTFFYCIAWNFYKCALWWLLLKEIFTLEKICSKIKWGTMSSSEPPIKRGIQAGAGEAWSRGCDRDWTSHLWDPEAHPGILHWVSYPKNSHLVSGEPVGLSGWHVIWLSAAPSGTVLLRTNPAPFPWALRLT